VKKKLILCIGYPFSCDKGLGYHVSKVLEQMELPEDVELLEVGESVSEFDYTIDGREKMIVVDSFQTGETPGKIVSLRTEEVPMTVNGVTDMGKYHMLDTIEQIAMSGHCPDIVFMGIVAKDVKTDTPTPKLSPEVEEKVPELASLIVNEIAK